MKTFKRYIFESKENTKLNSAGLIQEIGKVKFNKMIKHKWFVDEIRHYDVVYKYTTGNGFTTVTAIPYSSTAHKTKDGSIRPPFQYQFIFTESKLIQVHKFMRDAEKSEYEKFSGIPSWTHVKSWKN